MKNYYSKIKPIFFKYGIWLILFLAIVLRLIGYLNTNVFYGTTSELYRDLLVEYNFLVNHQTVLLGPSSSLGGFYFGPVYYYLLAPFTWLFNFHPAGALLTSTVFSLLTIYVFYKLIILWTKNINVALLASFLLATSMQDIQFSYYISNPNILPFFQLSFFYCLTLYLQKTYKWYHLLFGGIAAAIATQLHATALLVLPLSLLVIFFISKNLPKVKDVLLVFMGGIVTYIPYIYFEVTNQFVNSRRIFNLGGNTYSWKIRWQSIYSMVENLYGAILFKNSYFDLRQYNSTYFYILSITSFILILAGYIIFKRQSSYLKINFSHSAKTILTVWFSLCFLMFLFYQKDIPNFYYLVFWPLQLIFLAVAFYIFIRQKYFLILLLSFYVLAQGVCLYYFYGNLHNSNYDHKLILSSFRSIGQDANGKTFNVFDGTDNMNLFQFYLALSGLNKKITKYDSQVLYYIYNSKDVESIEAQASGKYYLVKEEIDKNIKIIKYSK